MKKRLLLLFCVLSCVVMATGCSLVKGNENFKTSDLEQQTDDFIDSWFAADFQGTIDTYKDQMDADTLALYKKYAKQKKKYQGIKKKIKTEFTITTDSATVTETVLCDSGDKLLISLTFDEDGSVQTDDNGNYTFKFEQYKTLGQKMQKAALNTVMSMAIVFCVLIFISLIISCFKLIGALGNKKTTAPTSQTGQASSAPRPVQQSAQENLVDDLELVAVITAAIVAAEGSETADGLVVRSIIRR